MKKILVTAPRTSGKGGTETVIKQLLDSSLATQYDITLFVARVRHEEWLKEIPDSIKIVNGGHDKYHRLSSYVKTLLSNDFDVIMDTNTKTIKLDYWIRRLFHKNYCIISWIHFSLYDVPTVNIEDLLLADEHLAISSGIEEQIHQLDESAIIHKIYNPIEKKEILKLKSDSITHFVYLGRLEWHNQKNLELLLNSLNQIDKNRFVLDFYGSGKDETRIKQFVLENHIQANFFGWLSNPWGDIQKNGINYLVLSSKYEGFPMAISEALSRGVPVISTNCPTGPRDLITNNLNGFLLSEGQYKLGLKEAINKKNQWNQNEIQGTITKFSKDKYIKTMISIIEGNI